MAGPFTESEVITRWGTREDGFRGANAPDMNLNLSAALPTIPTPGWRTLWNPWDLKVMTAGRVPVQGGDGRDNFWRFISLDGNYVYTDILPTRGCSEIMAIICVGGTATAGNTTFSINPEGWSNIASSVEIYNVQTQQTVAQATGGAWSASFFNFDSASGAAFKMAAMAPCTMFPYFRFAIKASAADIPLTVWISGR